jgi:hypothetical protein
MFTSLIVASLLFFADEPKQPARPTVGDYEQVMKKFTDWSENLSNPEHWKGTKLRNKKTGEVVLFEKLPEFEQRVFYVISAENLSTRLKDMQTAWEKELAELKKNPPPEDKKEKEEKKSWVDKEKADDSGKKTARQTDVEQYLAKLLELRKATAVRYEAMLEKLFTDYKDKFSEEERKHNMQAIREWHDKEKLIDRNKK